MKAKSCPKQWSLDVPHAASMIEAAALVRLGVEHFLEAMSDADVDEMSAGRKIAYEGWRGIESDMAELIRSFRRPK